MHFIARLSTIVTAVAVLGVSSASAQPPPQGGSGRPQQDLSATLHLRPDQQGAYQAFEQANHPRPDEISRLRAAGPQSVSGLPTPQRLDRIGAYLTLQLQMFHRASDATLAFYRQLSPDQQRAFDQATALPSQGRGGPQG